MNGENTRHPAALRERISEWPVTGAEDKAAAEAALAELGQRAAQERLDPLVSLLRTPGPVRDLLLGIAAASPYLRGLCLRRPATLWQSLDTPPEARADALRDQLSAQMAAASSMAEAMRALREAKNDYALLVALADIGGVWGVDQATAALSNAADALVGEAVRFLARWAAGQGALLPADPQAPERASGLIILGMGKYGAHELNYSSDIDLIVFYDTARLSLARGIEPGPFFVRLTRDLVRLLHERTGNGYVFRTDLRLRPDPGATQLALSTDAAFQYYESFGQNWERAAFIKARAVAGDIEAGKRFLAELAPFIWRKYLDFAAIADVHAMKRQIHAFRGHGRIAVRGHNLKLGRGGIREIEFFVQTQQLIAGGRQPDLRERQTLSALEHLAARGWVTPEAVRDLSEAYRFLRRIEHRVQMINDEQTHSLPSGDAELARFAHFCGFADEPAFAAALSEQLRRVEKHYAALFEKVPELGAVRMAGNLVFTGDSDDPETLATLAHMGYQNPSAVIATIRGWHYGRYRAVRTARARENLTEFLPALLEALAQTAHPDGALAAFDKFVAELPEGIQLFALLRNNPPLLRLIADIMGTAPRLATVLSRRRRVIDAVLDPGYLGVLPSEIELGELIETELAQTGDYESALNRARIVGQEQQFLIGVGLLSGTVSAQDAASAYSRLADCLIRALKPLVEREIERAHGKVTGGGSAIIAMGKLGGREMTASSDLDLIVVYDFAPSVTASDGPKPLSPSQYYARFTQRLIAALSALTSEGRLYEVDMRLRPSGRAGPVAASLETFIDYQRNHAWTWEHMALTRARVVAGPPELSATLQRAIADVLTKPRDAAVIARDVLEMRARIEHEKGTKDIWDLKQVRGGLVDLEFLAQYHQLVNAARHPDCLDQNTLGALQKLAGAGLLHAGAAEIALGAARLYQDVTQIVRLCAENHFDPETAPEGLKHLIAHAGGEMDFARIEARLRDEAAAVAGLFERIGAAAAGDCENHPETDLSSSERI